MAKLTPIPQYRPSTTTEEAEATRVAKARTTRDYPRPDRYGPRIVASDLVSRVAGQKVSGAIQVTGGTD